ncbi:hypothetical protein HU751_014145 [Pseudomonas sp. BW13M1]|uniref:Delta-60 repeat domain-containing protein n=1 Tax=Pseudomonas peradeniyensis TaxID=2745488 RepID=A0A923G5N8_9PSED|nr:hypothetical protein [Pseudomonas peradeniyensis]MBV4505989.1 hypothetical protein [Pseudomonas peradeniyensis]
MATSYVLDTEFNGSGLAQLPMYDNSTDRHVIDLTHQGKKLLAAAVTEKINGDGSLTHYYALTRFDNDGSIDTTFGKPGNKGIVFGLFDPSSNHGQASDSGCVSIAIDGKDGSSIWMLGWSSEHRDAPKSVLIAKFDQDATIDPTPYYLPQPTNSSLQVARPGWEKEAEQGLRLQEGRSSLLVHDNHLIATANFDTQGIPPRLYRQGFNGEPGFGELSFIEITHTGGNVTLTGLAVSNNALLICGYLSNENSESGFIARYQTNGELDTTFGKDGTLTFQIDRESKHATQYKTRVQQLCIRNTDEILATGSRRFEQTDKPNTVKLDGWAWQLLITGQRDEHFNAGNPQITERENDGVEWKTGVIEQDHGALLFGAGSFGTSHLQRYEKNGTADPLTPLPDEIKDTINAMIALEQDEKIVLAANLRSTGGYIGYVIRLVKNRI